MCHHSPKYFFLLVQTATQSLSFLTKKHFQKSLLWRFQNDEVVWKCGTKLESYGI